MNSNLLGQFDDFIHKKGYSNRSEAIRDLVRDQLIQSEWEQASGDQLGTLTLIYDHHTPNLIHWINEVQHRHHPLVISSMHVHLENEYCLEVLAVRGAGQEIRRFSNYLLSLKGVKHGQLVMTTTGKTFQPRGDRVIHE